MKLKAAVSLGKRLTLLGRLRVVIVDDEAAYFTPHMLEMARAAGYANIERVFSVTPAVLGGLLTDPPDIVILDIMGVAEPEVAKDGAGIAVQLHRQTAAYVAATSAHQFHLRNAFRDFDYVIEERLLTGVDFIAELDHMADDFFRRRRRFMRGLAFRAGRALIRWGTLTG